MGCNSFDREKGRVSVCAHFALFVYIYCSVRSFKKLIFHHFYCSYNGLYVLFSFNMAIVHSLLLLVVGAVCCHKPIWLPHWSNINPIRANSWANNINCHVMKYMRELEVPMWVCACVCVWIWPTSPSPHYVAISHLNEGERPFQREIIKRAIERLKQ